MKKIIVLLTACLLLIGSMAGVVASAQDVSRPSALAAESYPDLDYSMGAKKYGTAYMGDVLEQLLGAPLTEEEKNVIRSEFPGQNVLTYKRPSIVNPQVSYDGENGELCVVVKQDYIFAAHAHLLRHRPCQGRGHPFRRIQGRRSSRLPLRT